MTTEIVKEEPSDVLAAVVTDLEPESALSIRSTFVPLFAAAEEWTRRASAIHVTSIDQKREMKLARESRLAVRECRINAENARKRLKTDIVRRGKAIDGAANIIKDLLEPIEIYLLEQETFAERHEKARKEELRGAREEALRALGADPSVYANLGETDAETWESTLQTAKDAHEARVQAAKEAEEVRLEAERLAAQKREAARAEKVRQEAERAERERVQAEENERLRKEKAEIEAQRKRDVEAAQADARAQREKAEAEARAAREEKARVEAELAAERAKAEAERKAEEDRAAAEAAAARAAALAPDREKLAAFAASLRGLPVPDLTTTSGQEARAKLVEQLEKFARWIDKTGEAL